MGLLLEISTECEIAMSKGVEFWGMSWGSHALVLEPESLREEIRAEVEVILHRYERAVEKEEKSMEV